MPRRIRDDDDHRMELERPIPFVDNFGKLKVTQIVFFFVFESAIFDLKLTQ